MSPATIEVSVIVPTLNAAELLAACLESVTRAAEIIVVDGGSTDGTVRIAAESGARFLTAPRGRGSQIAAGIIAASHPWLLLLHADTRLSPDWPKAIHADPGQAGYFRLVLDSANPKARRLERLVGWRCRVLALPYGDQGLLIHRDLLQRAGGMKTQPLMEDVDLIRRLGRARLVPLAADAVTSACKWETEGYLRRSTRNLLCLGLWFAGLPLGVIIRLYR